MDMTNPTYGWSADSFEQMLSEGDWSSLELNNDLDLDSSLDSHVTWSSSSSSSEYGSPSEYINSKEWTTAEEESSMSLSTWFIDTEEHWVIDEPKGVSEDALIAGVVGFYDIDRSLHPEGDDHEDWHEVEIVWDSAKESFMWQTKAGVRWSLTPVHETNDMGGWDTTKLVVGEDSPYYKEGSHFATVEWGMVEGAWVVTGINGPWDEPYLRNFEHDSDDHFNIDWDSINIDDLIGQKPEPSCDEKVRKITEQRTTELDHVRFEHEEELEMIRIEREEQLVKIRHQLNEETEVIQIAQRTKMEQFLSKREQCEDQNDEETCRAEWDRKIDDKRAHYEEQMEIVREEKDEETESVRRRMDAEIERIRVTLVQEIKNIERDTDVELQRLRVEREKCAGDVMTCTDAFDDKIEQVRVRLEEDIRRMRLEQNRILERVVIQRNRQLEIIEMARKQEITAMRLEWRRTCTDKCTLCREEQEGLLELVHRKREDQLRGIRVHWDNQIMKFKVHQKRAMDLVVRQRRVEIEKIYAQRKTCPQIVKNEEELCRQKVTVEMEKVRVQRDDEIELAQEHSEEDMVKIVIEYDGKVDAIVAQKRTELHAIHVEREQVLKKMLDSRFKCGEEGQQKVETCKEKIEAQLINVRSERDTLLDELREKREADMERVVALRKTQLVKVQSKLEEELTSIHEDRDRQLRELKTTCGSSMV